MSQLLFDQMKSCACQSLEIFLRKTIRNRTKAKNQRSGKNKISFKHKLLKCQVDWNANGKELHERQDKMRLVKSTQAKLNITCPNNDDNEISKQLSNVVTSQYIFFDEKTSVIDNENTLNAQIQQPTGMTHPQSKQSCDYFVVPQNSKKSREGYTLQLQQPRQDATQVHQRTSRIAPHYTQDQVVKQQTKQPIQRGTKSFRKENKKPSSILNVVAGLVLDEENNKILLAQRPAHKRHAFKWEFPGGKVDKGESLQQAVVRELEEELGIFASTEEVVEVTFSSYVSEDRRPIVILICLYHIKKYQGNPYGREGQSIRWCTLEEMQALDMPPGDLIMLDQVKMYVNQLR
eukprot:TRINITY_DN5407_c0_g1_i17.p1 TRINITY_DN5407_c0_g1~~TRINITY_DN5407_c0_g1_i17.p1  ORF type:complete len:347 (-),score=16.43 TRINITY_DN5407_c0_g1_i17:513-1553(-)